MSLKPVILLFGISLIALSCAGDPKTAMATFSGSVSNADEIAVTQVEDINRKKVRLIDRITVRQDGSFSMSFENLEPHLYELNFPNGKKFRFISDEVNELVFKGNAENPDSFEVTGSADNELLAAYEEFRKESLERLVLSVRKRLKEMPVQNGPEYERLGKLEVTNYEKHKLELLDFVKNKMGTSPAIYATSTRWPSDPALVEPIVSAFEKVYPTLSMTARMKEKLALIKQTAIGGTAPDIKMRDGTGEEISLYGKKGKYTLVDFWGSWCGPCRREAETLAGLYAEYKGKGFEIFGVGLESDLAKWKEAKELDKRIWPNVLSLTELETEAAYDYAISALPANFLIDAEGKIIARDLHDEELRSKLEELFEGE